MTQPLSRSGPPAPDPDPFTTVRGMNGTPYRCPDVAALDHHILGLCQRIQQVSDLFPELVEDYRAEIDLLLDRRLWLAMNPGPGIPVA